MKEDKMLAIIETELCSLALLIKRSNVTWSSTYSKSEDLIKNLLDLKRNLTHNVNEFLAPFLNVVKAENVNGIITGFALDALHKFLTYGFLDNCTDGLAIQNVADAVTHARFLGVDTSSDEIVLLKILKVLRDLLLSKMGNYLTNESICEILQSTFRITFENRLSELLRKSAEEALKEMVALLFTRLSLFSDESLPALKRLKMRHHEMNSKERIKSKKTYSQNKKPVPKLELNSIPFESTTSSIGLLSFHAEEVLAPSPTGSVTDLSVFSEVETSVTSPDTTELSKRGVTFTQTVEIQDSSGALIPYGLPCVRELFRFLVSLINSSDPQNQSHMIEISIHLLTTALENGVSVIHKFESLLAIVKDELSRHLTALLSHERISIYNSSLWLFFLLASDLRAHLKFQLEIYLTRLSELINSESPRFTYEHKEVSLDLIVRLYKLPGFVTQIYLNYDCDIYTHNLFADLTKMLSTNSYPLGGDLHSTHFLSLDALLTVIEVIESQSESELPSSSSSSEIPSASKLASLQKRKKMITASTETFNSNPPKGIAYLMEEGLLSSPLDPHQVASYLRENPHLDKKHLGDYLSNRKNLPILEAFVTSFDFEDLRIDESLRLFLESFRLPGEAPLITLVMEHFASHWQKSNPGLLASNDSAFTLAYAIIMLNVDQHNVNAIKTSEPMTEEQFIRNLRGTNDGKDHDVEMLREIYADVKNHEIVMPAEQSGSVKENYLWKCVLKRGVNSSFILAHNGSFNRELFSIVWGPSVAALSYAFDKSQEPHILKRSILGFTKTARIAAENSLIDVFDNLIISLCKFTSLLSVEGLHRNSSFILAYAENDKGLLATQLLFSLLQKHGDILREGWKNVLEVVLQLFRAHLLPESLMESEDYLTESVSLYRDNKNDSELVSGGGFLNSFVSFISMQSDSSTLRSTEDEELLESLKKIIAELNLENILIKDSKFLLEDSLNELIKSLLGGSEDDTDSRLFFGELVFRIAIHNRDRISRHWPSILEYIGRSLHFALDSEDEEFLLNRAVNSLFRMIISLSRKEEMSSSMIQSLRILFNSNRSLNILGPTVAIAIFELVRSNGRQIYSSEDWSVILNLLRVVALGEEKEKEETTGNEWIFLESKSNTMNSLSFVKSLECLSFLILGNSYVTPLNFSYFVNTLKNFVDVSIVGPSSSRELESINSKTELRGSTRIRRVMSAPSNMEELEELSCENDANSPRLPLQLLELLYTLHTDVTAIFAEDKNEDLWSLAWFPILQSMAKLCTDKRNQVRTSALTTLQRSFLIGDLHAHCTPSNWESSLTKVLFPMLTSLLLHRSDEDSLEETRIRGATLLGKVFLQHLSPLSTLGTFTSLWITILEYMEQLYTAANSDLLADAVPESLKNMLLVMDTANLCNSELWRLTKTKLEAFLPNLISEVFEAREPRTTKKEESEESSSNVQTSELTSLLTSSIIETSTSSTSIDFLDLSRIPPPPIVSLSQPPILISHVGFSPIDSATPITFSIPIASPKPVLASSNLASYFGQSSQKELLFDDSSVSISNFSEHILPVTTTLSIGSSSDHESK